MSGIMIALRWGLGAGWVREWPALTSPARLEGSLCLQDLLYVCSVVSAGGALRDLLATWLQILVGLLQRWGSQLIDGFS